MLRILLLSAIVLSPGCSKPDERKETQSPAAVSLPAPAPTLGQVIATVQLPSGNSVAELEPMIEQFQQGGTAMAAGYLPVLLAEASGMSLLSADLSKPVSLVIVDPEAFKEPVGLLVTATDLPGLESAAKDAGRVAISRNGLTLLATPEVAESVQDFAFAKLAEPSTHITAVAYPKPLLKIYRSEIDQGMGEVMASSPQLGPMIEQYRNALLMAGEQTERIVLRFSSSSTAASVLFHFYPNSQSTMASFVKAQIPSKHELLSKLPAGSGQAMVFSGDMRAGDAKEALIDFGNVFMESMFRQLASTDELKKIIAAWYDTFDGQFAGTMSMSLMPGATDPGLAMSYLIGTHDAVGMRSGWVAWMKAMTGSADNGVMESMGMKFSVDYKQNVAQVDGIEVDKYVSKIDLATVPSEQLTVMEAMGEQAMHLAVFDSYGIMIMAKDSLAKIEEVVAIARGKKPGFVPGKMLAGALADSTERQESLLFFMDMAALSGGMVPMSSVVMAVGKDEDALVLRVGIGY